MPLRLITALVLSIVCLAVSAWADYQAGMDAYNRGDFKTALREWQPLAEQGDARAQFSFGLLYEKGDGVPRDYAKARQWYEKAAVRGDLEAAASLGTLHLNGQGGVQDYQKALDWYRRAAARDHAMAFTNLGLMYEHGKGVPQDFIQANKYYILGAARGDKLGAELRDAIEKQMTPAQIFQAQQRAKGWKAKTRSAPR